MQASMLSEAPRRQRYRRFMQPGIRIKFIGILIVAAVLPLCVGIIAVWILGSYHYRLERGTFFQSLAIHFAQNLNEVVDKQIEEMDDWLVLSDLHARIRACNATLPKMTDAEFAAHIQQVEARWPTLDVAAPELRDLLQNDIARQLDSFQSLHPLFAEIMVTDIKGQLVAATGKTSDYWQADEEWWQRGIKVAYRRVYIEGVTFDDSAKVYSIDVAIPIRDRMHSNAPPVGVAKGILNISPLFSSVQPISSDRRARRQLVDPHGYIVFDKYHPEVVPFSQRVNPDVVKRLALSRTGWILGKLNGIDTRLIGFTSLKLTSPLMDDSVPFKLTPLYVIVHDDAAAVLAPVRRQLRVLSVAGVLVIMVFALAGLYIANRRIIAPIQRLRTAAQLVATSAKLGETRSSQPRSNFRRRSARILHRSRSGSTDSYGRRNSEPRAGFSHHGGARAALPRTTRGRACAQNSGDPTRSSGGPRISGSSHAARLIHKSHRPTPPIHFISHFTTCTNRPVPSAGISSTC